MSVPEEEVVQRPNLLKPKRLLAYQAAQTAVDEVIPGEINPLTSVGNQISVGEAWVSPMAGPFVTDLTGHGATLLNAFRTAESHLQGEYASEPETVAVPGPQAWKANGQLVRQATI